MCIIVSSKRFYITKEPKTCYKVLFKHNKKLYPPYYYEKMYYELNLKYSIPEGEFEETIEDFQVKLNVFMHYNSSMIPSVGFYSFNNIESARKLKETLENSLFYHNKFHFVIVECEIPENTKYLSGQECGYIFSETSHQTYCSQSIIIRKIIE